MPPKASTRKGSATDDKQPKVTAFFGKAPLRESLQPAAARAAEPSPTVSPSILQSTPSTWMKTPPYTTRTSLPASVEPGSLKRPRAEQEVRKQ